MGLPPTGAASPLGLRAQERRRGPPAVEVVAPVLFPPPLCVFVRVFSILMESL